MSIHRRNPRRDKNEPEIIGYALKFGFSVRRLSGSGIPDLLLGKRKHTRVAEVKTDEGTLTDDQKEFWDSWRGNEKIILRTFEDVVAMDKAWPK